MFYYHAHASVLGGSIRRPFSELITVPCGSSSLASAGGYHTSEAGPYRLRNLISFERAYTQVSGSRDAKGLYNTHASVVIEKFSLLDVVTADRIVAQISSTHEPGQDESEIRVTGTHFVDLRIGGKLIEVNVDATLISNCPKLSDLEKHYAGDPSVKQHLDAVNYWRKPAHEVPDFMRDRVTIASCGEDELPKSKGGVTLMSLLAEPLPPIPGGKSFGNAVHLPGIGRLFFAELQISARSKRISMLRFDLGSPSEGGGSAGEPDVNGSEIP